MIMEFVAGTRIRQCEQADYPPAGQVSRCCNSDFTLNRPGACDHPGLPEFRRWQVTDKRNTPRVPLSWGKIKEEIDAGRPIAFSLMDAAETYSHMMVLVGYIESNGVNYIQYLSPRFSGGAQLSVAEYQWYVGNGEPEGLAKHQYDYFEIQF